MKLRDWRKTRDLSLAQAAAMANVAAVTWWRWETGHRKPRPDNLAVLQRLTDGRVTANDVYGGAVDGAGAGRPATSADGQHGALSAPSAAPPDGETVSPGSGP